MSGHGAAGWGVAPTSSTGPGADGWGVLLGSAEGSTDGIAGGGAAAGWGTWSELLRPIRMAHHHSVFGRTLDNTSRNAGATHNILSQKWQAARYDKTGGNAWGMAERV